jgi:hypothetical protein
MTFVDNQPGVGLRNIRDGFKDKSQQFDLKHYFHITPDGREYLRLRKELAEESQKRVAIRISTNHALFWSRFNSSARRIASPISFMVLRRLRACFLMML